MVRSSPPGIPEGGVLVLGAGVSGLAAARFLASGGRPVAVVDDRPAEEIERAEDFRSLGVRLLGGGIPATPPEDVRLIVASPGILPSAPIFRAAGEAGVPVWGELELGYRALGEPAERIVAVTGTKGKSSVVTLIAEALRREGVPAVAAGNLGTPLTRFAAEDPDEASGSAGPGPDPVFVVEASSFQLARIERFRPRVAVLLAVSGDHLDWHPDLDHYRSSKAQLFRNQTAEDWVVFDGRDEVASGIARAAVRRTGAHPLPFGDPDAAADPAVVMEDGARGRALRRDGSRLTPLARFAALRVPGAHARRNLAAAAAAASVFGAGQEAIEASARAFEGMPYALEEVGTVDGVRFVNDSRATSLAATTAALEALAEEVPPRSVGLILGGILKAGRYRDLEGNLDRVAGVWAIGQSRSRVADDIESVPVTLCDSLEEAVRGAFDAVRERGAAASGEGRGVVLLSPGCSSFDQFASYARRGQAFAEVARDLGAREVVG